MENCGTALPTRDAAVDRESAVGCGRGVEETDGASRSVSEHVCTQDSGPIGGVHPAAGGGEAEEIQRSTGLPENAAAIHPRRPAADRSESTVGVAVNRERPGVHRRATSVDARAGEGEHSAPCLDQPAAAPEPVSEQRTRCIIDRNGVRPSGERDIRAEKNISRTGLDIDAGAGTARDRKRSRTAVAGKDPDPRWVVDRETVDREVLPEPRELMPRTAADRKGHVIHRRRDRGGRRPRGVVGPIRPGPRPVDRARPESRGQIPRRDRRCGGQPERRSREKRSSPVCERARAAAMGERSDAKGYSELGHGAVWFGDFRVEARTVCARTVAGKRHPNSKPKRPTKNRRRGKLSATGKSARFAFPHC